MAFPSSVAAGRSVPRREGALRAHAGFTLIELIVVMFILGLGAAMVSINFSRFLTQAQESRWADQTLRELNRARGQAIMSGQKVFAFVDPAKQEIRVEKQSNAAAGDAAKDGERPMPPPVVSLPKRYRFVVETDAPDADPEAPLEIRFYPDGSATLAAFAVVAPSGKRYQVGVSGLTGRITMEREN